MGLPTNTLALHFPPQIGKSPVFRLLNEGVQTGRTTRVESPGNNAQIHVIMPKNKPMQNSAHDDDGKSSTTQSTFTATVQPVELGGH